MILLVLIILVIEILLVLILLVIVILLVPIRPFPAGFQRSRYQPTTYNKQTAQLRPVNSQEQLIGFDLCCPLFVCRSKSGILFSDYKIHKHLAE